MKNKVLFIDAKSYAQLLQSHISDQTHQLNPDDSERWEEIHNADSDEIKNKILAKYYQKEVIPHKFTLNKTIQKFLHYLRQS